MYSKLNITVEYKYFSNLTFGGYLCFKLWYYNLH